jgi:DNA-binding transcriptional ArsR family regulator
VRALDEPGARALHLPWIEQTLPLLADLDLDVLRALTTTESYSPDFVNPPPSTPLAQLDDELEQVTRTPPQQVRAEILRTYGDTSVPEVLRPFVERPAQALGQLRELVRTYWERALAPHWPRLRSLLEGDVLYRARRLADGGARRLFAEVHPEVHFAHRELRILKRVELTVALEGRGVVFVPSAFVWPRVVAIVEPPWQPTLIYPARGVGTLWEHQQPTAPGALRRLLGKRRATILVALESPRSTTELARALSVTPGSVSQHLAVLVGAGLVHQHRVGRVVLYARSPIGDALVRGA